MRDGAMGGMDCVADAVMRGVIASGALDGPSRDLNRACEIMRDECRAFFTPSDSRYADERACVLSGSMHDGWILAAIVARCVSRIVAGNDAEVLDA